ncbi:endonuclease/exonuclease/phosphatase family protein [Marivibrio halodurans]|uniref:Endonuclease/exonuclease/phosphatase family protein n=1 Tax=Marivibrio halodurans TaxID=2039722 RepID=A0A8J7SLH5_9PROT|nr:endonuclease/exonuclease/phosphatase family protein [Marivibrio halodurans]MBP5856863.1 endonuclease/exonuclease/phosphatase family protein [Marivibrio halodurans]
MTRIRLATYNVHKFIGADTKRNVPRILKVIEAIDADILAVQEFMPNKGGLNARDADQFAENAGYHVVSQPIRRVTGNYQANLLLSRLPAHRSDLVDLKHRRNEPRGAILAEFEIGAHSLTVIATHLGLTPRARAFQLDRLLALAPWRDGGYFALMGDLNAFIPWGPVDRRLRREFRDHARPASFPAGRPMMPLDRIAIHPGHAVEKVGVHDVDPAPFASDHLPVVADLNLPD